MDLVQDYTKTEDPIVTEAKRLFSVEYGRLQASSRLEMNKTRSGKGVVKNKLQPLWNLYKDGNTSKLTAIEVPIVQTQNSIPLYNLDGQASSLEIRLARAKKSFTRLLHFRQGSDAGRQLLVTYIPEYSYIEENEDTYQKKDVQLRNLAALDYSGYVEYRELNGEILSVLLFKDGQLKRRYHIREKSNEALDHFPRLVQQSYESRRSLEIIGGGGGWNNCDWVCIPRMYQNCTGNMEAGDNPDEICGEWYETDACDYEFICDETPPEDPYPPYNPDPDPCSDPANYWMCGGGGNDGGGGNGATNGITTPTLSQAEKQYLQEAVDSLDRRCGFKTIYNKIMSEGTVEIRMGNTNAAVYQPGPKVILYNQNIPQWVMPNVSTLAHELFHAYQHQFVYGTVMTSLSSNHINIEFEQIVYQDIVKRISDGPDEVGDMFKQSHLPGFDGAKEQYRLWINTLTNHGTAYPDLNSISGFDAAYMAQLNVFKTYGHHEYISSDVIQNMLPDALKQLFNNKLDCND